MLNPTPTVAPGPYPGPGQAPLLRAGESQYLLRNQLVAAGTSSIAVQLERIKSGFFYPFAVSLQIWFTDVNGNAAAPGAFEVDAQTSDLDTDAQFCNETGLTAVNSSQVGRIVLTVSWMKYLRVNVKTLTNSVYVWVLATR